MYLNNLVSIICAAYNASSYIEETIQAILSQTYCNWELIVIDDCSKDNTAQIVSRYTKIYSNILLIKNENNLGPGLSRNKGIEMAQGRYIAICDSDDVWFPQKLEKQLSFMKSKGDIPISYTTYELIDEKSCRLNTVVRVVKQPLFYSDYLKNTIIGFSTSMIDRTICPEIELPDMPSREDTFLWCSLLKLGYNAYGLDEILVKYRIHGNSISANKIKASKQVWELYRDCLKIPFAKRLFYFSCYAFNAFKKRFLKIKI